MFDCVSSSIGVSYEVTQRLKHVHTPSVPNKISAISCEGLFNVCVRKRAGYQTAELCSATAKPHRQRAGLPWREQS